MASITPLPFRIRLPGEDSVHFTEVRDVTRRADGMLHLLSDALLLEWAVTESIDEVGLGTVKSATETYATEELEVPLEWLASAELIGGILRPRVLLRGRGLGVFEEVPGSKADRLELHYKRADRLVAVDMATAIATALAALPTTDEVERGDPSGHTPVP